MRTIEISTEVFSRIWAQRIEGEESENAILARLLGASNYASRSVEPSAPNPDLRVRWRDDVKQALVDLGGSAPLSSIYRKVREIRRAAGRKLPYHTDAIIRRELEQNSPASDSHTGKRDWFMPVHRLGRGVWKLCDVQ
jgi:hypothetical protein